MPNLKKAIKKRTESALQTRVRALFRAFTDLAEKVAAARPLLRGARVGRDPQGDRFVVVHAGSQVEFLLATMDEAATHGEIVCNRISSSGTSEGSPLARLVFSEAGIVTESSVGELMDSSIVEAEGAASIVASVMWASQG